MSVLSGAKCVYVPLKSTNPNAITSSSDWKWSDDELRAAFTNKTKLVIINTPNNPLGKVYSKEELQTIADLCIKHNCICISDEVYEYITYDMPHIRIGI
jgi:kynurenine---oxoglutarate transaminase / cysteine-S-conjugate beta-lyase / glutamine---phenylpyruvate transaminase